MARTFRTGSSAPRRLTRRTPQTRTATTGTTASASRKATNSRSSGPQQHQARTSSNPTEISWPARPKPRQTPGSPSRSESPTVSNAGEQRSRSTAEQRFQRRPAPLIPRYPASLQPDAPPCAASKAGVSACDAPLGRQNWAPTWRSLCPPGHRPARRVLCPRLRSSARPAANPWNH